MLISIYHQHCSHEVPVQCDSGVNNDLAMTNKEVEEREAAVYVNSPIYRENFALLNFYENGNFNNFAKNIFTNDPHGQHKRRGMAVFRKILFHD